MEMRDDAPVCELPRFAENLCERFRIGRSAASNSNFCAGPQHEPNIKRGRQPVATLSWRIRSARVLESQVRGSEDCISAPRMIVTSEPSSGIELEARAGPVRRRAESLERLLGHFRGELEQLLRLGTCSRELLLDKIGLQANGLR